LYKITQAFHHVLLMTGLKDWCMESR